MRFLSVIFLLFAQGHLLAGPPDRSTPEYPEDLLLSDALFSTADASRNYLVSSFLFGDGGFWTAELELGREFASGWQLGILGAHSTVGGTATDEGWLNGGYVFADGTSLGLSVLYGGGPSAEKYYGATASLMFHDGDWRVKVQSGLVHFEASLSTEQIPLRVEIGYVADETLTFALGGAYFFYTQDRALLTSALATTTATTGTGILSGFPLDQVYGKVEAHFTPKLKGSLSLSSAATAYRTDRISSVTLKGNVIVTKEAILGAEVTASRSGTSGNFAAGPTLQYFW